MAFMCAAILCLKLFLLICLQPTMGLDISRDITPTPMGQNTTECADQGLQTGSLPHPSQCDKFFLCTNGDTELVSCPNGLAFNTHIKSCDYRVNVPECINGNELKTVKQELEDMTEKYHSMSQKMEGMSQELDELRKKGNKWDALTQKMDKLEEKGAYMVSFRATRRSSSAYLYKNNKIVFSQVTMNMGHAYNDRTGVFTVPVKGLYYFTLTLTASRGHGGHAYAHIERNRGGHIILLATLDAQDEKYQDQSTVAANAVLDAGETVYAMVYHKSRLQWKKTVSSKYEFRRLNQFSGFLVRALY